MNTQEVIQRMKMIEGKTHGLKHPALLFYANICQGKVL